MEGVNKGWSSDLEEQSSPSGGPDEGDIDDDDKVVREIMEKAIRGSAIDTYEEAIGELRQLSAGLFGAPSGTKRPRLEVESLDIQDFLAGQLEVIQRLRLEEKRSERKDLSHEGTGADNSQPDGRAMENGGLHDEAGRVNEHIGPVQFNMGGIQVDADDMLKRLKVNMSALDQEIKYVHS